MEYILLACVALGFLAGYAVGTGVEWTRWHNAVKITSDQWNTE